jgi:hypothetical protein
MITFIHLPIGPLFHNQQLMYILKCFFFLSGFLLPFLVVVPVTFTRNWTFCYEMIELTTPVAHLLGAGFVVFPPSLFEDLVEALDDERHFLVVELGRVDRKPN